MKVIKLSIYRNRSEKGFTTLLDHGTWGHRLSGVKLLPGDPKVCEVSFSLEALLDAIPGLRYEPPGEAE